MIMRQKTSKTRKKLKLQAAFNSHKKALYGELNVASVRVVEFGKTMAMVSGVLYVGYTVLDRFLDAKLRTEKKAGESGNFMTLNKIILPVLAYALQQGSVVLLKRAREILVNYLEKQVDENV